jgi:thiazole synthase
MDVGCEVLMQWVAPIGTGQGPCNARALRELRERAPNIPLIVDAGIGLPSHACQVMEWGFNGMLHLQRLHAKLAAYNLATTQRNRD